MSDETWPKVSFPNGMRMEVHRPSCMVEIVRQAHQLVMLAFHPNEWTKANCTCRAHLKPQKS